MFEPSKLTLTSRSISMITQMILLPFYLIVTQGINLVVLLVICGSLICSHVFAPTRSPIMFADFVPLVAVALVQHFWVARYTLCLYPVSLYLCLCTVSMHCVYACFVCMHTHMVLPPRPLQTTGQKLPSHVCVLRPSILDLPQRLETCGQTRRAHE